MKIQFTLPAYKDYRYESPETMIDKPIIFNDNVIGIVISSELDGSYFNCEGLIMDKFIHAEYCKTKDTSIELSSVVLKM